MRATVKLAIFGTAFLLAGCSSLNPFSSKKNVAAPAELTEFRQTLETRVAWTAKVGSAGNSIFTPAYESGTVYAASSAGTVVSIDSASGREQWRINAGMPLTAGVGTDGNMIVVAGTKGAVLAYNMNGTLLWKTQVSSEVLSAPAVGEGFVVVRSVDNVIVGLDAKTGARKWIVPRSTPALTLRSSPGIVIEGPTVVVGLPGGRLLSLALNNGGIRWELAVGDPRGATELERIADVSGFPAVYGRQICATAYQGRLGCADLVNGSARWSKELSSAVGPGIDERNVYVADEKGAVSAFTRESGQSVWKNDKLAYRRLTAPLPYGRTVAVGDGMGYVHFLSRDDGAFIGRLRLDSSAIQPNPIMAGNRLIFQTESGTLAAVTAN